MQHYFEIIKQSFMHLTLIQIPVIITFILAIVALMLGVIIILLDSAYRPNIPQYPFNIVLDRIVPICALISPTLYVLFLSPFDAWFTRFCLLLGIHIFILVPLFHYWSSIRQWSNDSSSSDSNKIWSWSHPRLFLHIAIAIIYPSLWGIYFSLSRYLRLGSTIDLSSFISIFFTFYLDWIILALFILPHLLLWIIIPFLYLSKIRRYLWVELSSLLYSLHLFLLAYNLYFIVMEKLFKFSHLCYSLISLNGLLYFKDSETYSKWRLILNFLFFHSGWFTIIFLLSLLIEIILKKGFIHYGIYTLFLYPLIRTILSSFFSLGNSQWVYSCCLSDYAHKQWKFPRYPIAFWEYFPDALFYYNFEWKLTEEEYHFAASKLIYYEWRLRKKVSRNVHQDLLYSKIRGNFKRPFGMRLAVSYVYSNRVRWVHSTAYKYHSSTSLFVKTIYDRIVLINYNWKHLYNIQLNDKGTVLPFKNLYLPFGRTYPLSRKTFIGVQEENIPTYFTEWIKRGVIVQPFDERNPTQNPDFKPQAVPDLYVNFYKSTFTDQRSHTLDQKTGDPGLGKHALLSEISIKRYETTINNFERDMRTRSYLTDNMIIALRQLKETCSDIKQHQLVWATNLHLFHIEHLPPLKIPQNFNTSLLTPEALKAILIAEIRMKKISDFLIHHKVPQTSHGIFPKEALDLFENSEIQRIFIEYPID